MKAPFSMRVNCSFVFLFILGCLTTAYSATTAWNVDAGDWGIAGNWTNGEPASSDMAYINNNGTATVSQVGEICYNLYCLTGGLHIVSGTLFATNEYFGNTAGNSATCVQDGGSNTVDLPGSGAYLYLGRMAGSTGIYILSSGYLDVMKTSGWGGEYIGGGGAAGGGYGYFLQTGGTNISSIKLGYGGRGVYDLRNGLCIAGRGSRACQIFSNGVFNQTGGRYTTLANVGTGLDGIYNLLGGEMYVPLAWEALNINSNAAFNMGNTNGTGLIWGSGGYLYIKAGGTLRGWGTNSCGGRFDMSGRVIADGWPGTTTERTLEISNFSDRRYPVPNTSSNGWYAVNRAKLVLSPMSAAVGTTTQAWGCAATNPVNDLVNSVKMVFSNVVMTGVVTNALLALDRSDVPPPSGRIPPMTVWQVSRSPDLALDTLTLQLRYDENARLANGILTGKLTIMRSGGGAWCNVATAVDTNNFLAVAHFTDLAVSEFIGIGETIPPRGTVFYSR